ncbi:MAG TPA: FAD/NAD(P)-binding oxidoreductase [Gemmatimonadaceae bacterium]|nr:FAD/NAD(P)-binding oxidoreductase [Gemmatimonadaceae bacterium]
MMAPLAGTDATLIVADVAIVGAGPAGIAAAVRAAESRLRVVVLDRGLETGGQIWRHMSGSPVPRIAQHWIAQLSRSGAQVIHGTSVVDVQHEDAEFEILADSSGSALRVRAGRIILATGARELFIPFDGWTLPGVMGIGGAQALLKSGASFAGKRVIVAGSGPLMLPVAASLATSGAKLILVAEQARRSAVMRFAAGLWRSPALVAQAARYRSRFLSTSYSTGTWVTAAHGADRLESVTVTDGRRTWREAVDVLCTGYGLVPNVELARLLGCETRDGAIAVDAQQRTTVANVLAVGEATGIGGAPLSLIEGEIAGSSVSPRGRVSDALLRKRAALEIAARRMLDAFALRQELRSLPTAGTIVCRCEDVSYGAVKDAACARQAKLYTRVGMGPCQGRTCMPGLDFLLAWQPDTVRPPIEPALVSVLSSELADDAAASILFNSSVGEAYQ